MQGSGYGHIDGQESSPRELLVKQARERAEKARKAARSSANYMHGGSDGSTDEQEARENAIREAVRRAQQANTDYALKRAQHDDSDPALRRAQHDDSDHQQPSSRRTTNSSRQGERGTPSDHIYGDHYFTGTDLPDHEVGDHEQSEDERDEDNQDGGWKKGYKKTQLLIDGLEDKKIRHKVKKNVHEGTKGDLLPTDYHHRKYIADVDGSRYGTTFTGSPIVAARKVVGSLHKKGVPVTGIDKAVTIELYEITTGVYRDKKCLSHHKYYGWREEIDPPKKVKKGEIEYDIKGRNFAVPKRNFSSAKEALEKTNAIGKKIKDGRKAREQKPLGE